MTELPDYQDHLILYIDLLGFSETSFNDVEKKLAVLKLLKNFAVKKRDSQIECDKNGNGYAIRAQPAISAFSDHVIISYPLKEIRETLNPSADWEFILSFFEAYIEEIAINALSLGFLVRGGITTGKLYHSQGVIFGEALIEAYKLESSVANYPRIVIHPKVLDLCQMNARMIKEDFDGLYYFHYLESAIIRLQFYKCLLDENRYDKTKEWIDAISSTIQRNIQNHTSSRDLTKLAKWKWFSRYFDEVLDSDSLQADLEKAATKQSKKRALQSMGAQDLIKAAQDFNKAFLDSITTESQKTK